jgi:hypothetical protein
LLANHCQVTHQTPQAIETGQARAIGRPGRAEYGLVDRCRQAMQSIAERDFNREGLGIEIDFSLPAERVIRSL